MAKRFAEGCAAIIGDLAYPFRIATKEGKHHKGRGNHNQRQPQGAIDADHQNHHAGGRDRNVSGGPKAGTIRDLISEEDQIEAGPHAEDQ